MHYLTEKEKKEVILECGDSALILIDYYISKGNIPNYEFNDSKTGYALGWKKEKVQRHRLLLEKNGYLYTKLFKASDGDRIINTYIGKENVLKGKQI